MKLENNKILCINKISLILLTVNRVHVQKHRKILQSRKNRQTETLPNQRQQLQIFHLPMLKREIHVSYELFFSLSGENKYKKRKLILRLGKHFILIE